MKTTFTLYRYEHLVKTNLLYVEELPEEQTFYIKVEGDNIEEVLNRISLPERLKQDLRADIVNIVRGYQMITANMAYTQDNVNLCKKYFRDMMSKFCTIHGIFYEFKEEEI